MKEAEKLSALIKNGENCNAAAYVESIYAENRCREYARCLVAVTLVKTVQLLNDTVTGFYCDWVELSEKVFSYTESDVEDIINNLCRMVKDARMVDRQRCYLKAAEFIRANFPDSQFSVGRVAEYTGVSQSFLTKLFCEKMGITPSEYVTKLRLEKSKELLQENMTVAEAAQASGFCTVETYIRTFKKCCTVTPGQWKRNKLFL